MEMGSKSSLVFSTRLSVLGASKGSRKSHCILSLPGLVLASLCLFQTWSRRLFHCSSLQKEKRKTKVLGKREVEGGFLPPGTWILPRDKSCSREAAPLPSMKGQP